MGCFGRDPTYRTAVAAVGVTHGDLWSKRTANVGLAHPASHSTWTIVKWIDYRAQYLDYRELERVS